MAANSDGDGGKGNDPKGGSENNKRKYNDENTMDTNQESQAVRPGVTAKREKMTLRIENYVTKGAFNATSAVKKVLAALLAVDTSILVCHVDDAHEIFGNKIPAGEFPNNMEGFEKFAKYERCKPAQRGERHLILIKIESAVTPKYLKRMTLETLRAQKLFFYEHHWNSIAVTSIGFIRNAHSKITHRENLRNDLQAAIDMAHGEATNKRIGATGPHIQIVPNKVGYKLSDKKHTAFVLEIQCAAADAAILRQYMYSDVVHQALGKKQYIPHGFALLSNDREFKRVINEQNQFTKSTMTIPIMGLPELVKQTTASDGMKVPDWLVKQINTNAGKQVVRDLEETDLTREKGRWLLLIDQNDRDVARRATTEALESLKHEIGHIEGFTQFNPYRADTPKETPEGKEHVARILASLKNPQGGDDMDTGEESELDQAPRNAWKRPLSRVIYTGDESEFPKLPSTKQQKRSNEDGKQPAKKPNAASAADPRIDKLEQGLASLTTKIDQFINNQVNNTASTSTSTAASAMPTSTIEQLMQKTVEQTLESAFKKFQQTQEPHLKAVETQFRTMNTTIDSLQQQVNYLQSFLPTQPTPQGPPPQQGPLMPTPTPNGPPPPTMTAAMWHQQSQANQQQQQPNQFHQHPMQQYHGPPQNGFVATPVGNQNQNVHVSLSPEQQRQAHLQHQHQQQQQYGQPAPENGNQPKGPAQHEDGGETS